MRLRVIAEKAAASSSSKGKAHGGRAAPLADTGSGNAGGGGAPLDVAGPDRDGTENGSIDESFFEARPWLDSDSEDDFYSVRGDFTPSRGSTPVHQTQTAFSGRIPVDRSKPSLTEKKQRLIELLQEKQHYDDEDDSASDGSSDMENSTVHAEEHLKPSRKGEKVKKPSKSGCFPSLVWKHSFKMCRNKSQEKRPQVN